MAIATQNTRLATIGNHPKEIGKKALRAISELNVAVVDASKFTAYMNDPVSVLSIDSEDRLEYSKIFRDAVANLTPVLQTLGKLQALDSGTTTKADYIADMVAGGFDLAEYSAQFE